MKGDPDAKYAVNREVDSVIASQDSTVRSRGNLGSGKHPTGQGMSGAAYTETDQASHMGYTPGEMRRRNFGPEDNVTPHDHEREMMIFGIGFREDEDDYSL